MPETYKASESGFLRIDQARKAKGWQAQDPQWLKKANVSLATLKRFRAREPVSQSYFIDICKAVGINDWQVIAETNEAPLLTLAYDGDTWVGRENIVTDLTQKLKNQCRLLIIAGLTGIGKTALAEHLLINLPNKDFKNAPLRVNLDDEGQPTDFSSFAAQLLEKSNQPIEPQVRNNSVLILEKLIRHLKSTRQFIVIDSLERLLKGNEYEGWNEFRDEGFVKFFHAVLSAENFHSRIILTSQDLPAQIESISSRYLDFLYCEALSGLSEKSRLQLFLKVFSKAHLDITLTQHNKDYLHRIGKVYEGHPLALKVIAGEISGNPFHGNVSAYWNKYGNEIEEIEQAIAEAEAGNTSSTDDTWQLHQLTRTLRKRVRHRLEQTFIRLKEDAYWAYVLLCAASVYRLPVPEEWWLDKLDYWEVSESDRSNALDILHDRYLLEEVVHDNQYKVRQHNLVRSVSLEHLRTLEG